MTGDEEYFKLLERIVNGAVYLSNPLIKPEDYAKYEAGYDKLCEKALEMRSKNSRGVAR